MKTKSTRINVFNSNKLLAVFVLFLLTTSCAGAGYLLGGSAQSYTGQYKIELDEARWDILDMIGKVGKSMSLNISSMDASRGSIGLSSGSSGVSHALVGSYSGQRISVVSTDGGKKLDVTVMVSGNFNAGSKEGGDKLFSDFKRRLLEKVR